MSKANFSLFQGRWDLYRKAEDDEKRHQARVKEAIRKNLVDLVSEESIVLSDGRRVLRVPIETLEEFRFRYADQASEAVGPSQTGSLGPAAGRPLESGREGGQTPGLEHLLETEITLDTADTLIFDDLRLPDWDPGRQARGGVGGYQFRDLKRTGIAASLAPRDTLKAALRHRGSRGCGAPPHLCAEDLRYRAYAQDEQDEAGAVVLAMMDTSGSMGSFEKYIARSFFFWTVRFLRTCYPRVELVFLAHDVRAREVDEESFFHRGASGGTVSSSVYRLAQEVLTDRYPPERYNAYAFHFTDGGNLTSDNPQALEQGQSLAQLVNLLGYGEIHDTARNPSPLWAGFSAVEHTRAVILRGKPDVFSALQKFFSEREEGS